MERFWDIIGELAEGFGNTLLLFVITLAVALPLGLLLAFGYSIHKILPTAWGPNGDPICKTVPKISIHQNTTDPKSRCSTTLFRTIQNGSKQ